MNWNNAKKKNIKRKRGKNEILMQVFCWFWLGAFWVQLKVKKKERIQHKTSLKQKCLVLVLANRIYLAVGWKKTKITEKKTWSFWLKCNWYDDGNVCVHSNWAGFFWNILDFIRTEMIRTKNKSAWIMNTFTLWCLISVKGSDKF